MPTWWRWPDDVGLDPGRDRPGGRVDLERRVGEISPAGLLQRLTAALVESGDVGAGGPDSHLVRCPPLLERVEPHGHRDASRLDVTEAGQGEQPGEIALAGTGPHALVDGPRVEVADRPPERRQRTADAGV